MQEKPKVVSISGQEPGKRVAIFCGIHGDEKAGIMTVNYLEKNLKPLQGEVILVYANPPAIANNVRYVNQNLNRVFLREKDREGYEDVIATELMDILDTCDALLDLHSYNERLGESTPFLICESDCFELVSKMDFKIIASGFDKIEKGSTDGYMFKNGKIGICAELGAIENPDEFVELGIKTAYQFLQYFDIVDKEYPYDSTEQSFIQADFIYKRQTANFTFSKKLMTFDKVTRGEIIAVDGNKELTAPYDGRILFPQPDYPIGVEAYLLARDLNKNSNIIE